MRPRCGASAARLRVVSSIASTSLTGPKEYRGVRNFESGEFGTIDFATALKYSVNTAFAQVALRLGPQKLFRYSNEFGFNHAPEMELEAGTSSFPKPLDEGDLKDLEECRPGESGSQYDAFYAGVAKDFVLRAAGRADVRARAKRAVAAATAATSAAGTVGGRGSLSSCSVMRPAPV